MLMLLLCCVCWHGAVIHGYALAQLQLSLAHRWVSCGLGWLLTVRYAMCVAGSTPAAEASSQSSLSRVLRPLLEQLMDHFDVMGSCVVTLSTALLGYEVASASGVLPTSGPHAGLAQYVQAIIKSEPLVRNRRSQLPQW
jgi:hypothetical protein